MTDNAQNAVDAPAAKRLISRNTPIIGNLTADPELRYTQEGKAVVNFTVAVTESIRNQQTGEWADGETTFYRVTAWDTYAEHIAASAVKGNRVVVIGDVHLREYDDRNGVRRSSIDVNAKTVAMDLRYGTATYVRAQAQSQGQQAPVAQPQAQPAAPASQAPQAQPVAQPQAQPVAQPQAQPVAQAAGQAVTSEVVF